MLPGLQILCNAGSFLREFSIHLGNTYQAVKQPSRVLSKIMTTTKKSLNFPLLESDNKNFKMNFKYFLSAQFHIFLIILNSKLCASGVVKAKGEMCER